MKFNYSEDIKDLQQQIEHIEGWIAGTEWNYRPNILDRLSKLEMQIEALQKFLKIDFKTVGAKKIPEKIIVKPKK